VVLAFPDRGGKGFEDRSGDALPDGVARLCDHPRFVESSCRWPAVRNYSPDGRLLPPLGLDRIVLSRHHATKAWRAAADALDQATGHLQWAVEAGGDVDDALLRWREAARDAIYTDKASRRHLRQKLALIAAAAGFYFQHGGGAILESNGERALAVIDHLLFCAEWVEDHPGRPRGRR